MFIGYAKRLNPTLNDLYLLKTSPIGAKYE
jgi:hypothetical protein